MTVLSATLGQLGAAESRTGGLDGAACGGQLSGEATEGLGAGQSEYDHVSSIATISSRLIA